MYSIITGLSSIVYATFLTTFCVTQVESDFELDSFTFIYSLVLLTNKTTHSLRDSSIFLNSWQYLKIICFMIWDIVVIVEIIYDLFLFKTWPTFTSNFITLGMGKINHRYPMHCFTPRCKTFQCLLGHKTIFLRNTTQS